jgi:type IV pilus assembly protein PilE
MYLIKNKQKGFTLIEIMIVVAILGILVAVAVPSYVEYVRKGHRADAKVELLRLAQMQESYFVQNLSYAKDLTTGAGGLGLGATVTSEKGKYTITVDSKDNGGGACTGLAADACTTFTLTATRAGSQVNDAKCGNYTLTNTGVKDVESATHTAAQCW